MAERARGMKVYLAGPMSGIPDFNAPEFRRVTGHLRDRGIIVLSPVEFDEAEGFDHGAGETTVPESDYRAFLARDLIRILSECIDAIVVLDGWEASRGAALEVHVARSLGVPVFRCPDDPLSDMEPVKAPTAYRPPSDENVLEEAQRIVAGDRGDDYGHPRDDFARTAGAWAALFGWDVSARQVALAMVVVKLSRLQETPDKRDSIVDIAGYARTYEMVLEREAEPAKHYPTTLS